MLWLLSQLLGGDLSLYLLDKGHIAALIGMGAEEFDQDGTYVAGDESYQGDLFW